MPKQEAAEGKGEKKAKALAAQVKAAQDKPSPEPTRRPSSGGKRPKTDGGDDGPRPRPKPDRPKPDKPKPSKPSEGSAGNSGL